VSTYTFSNVQASHTISVSFSSSNTAPGINIDFSAIWNAFVKNVEALIDASRQLLLVVGGFMALISGLMLIMPSKRSRVPWG
jgi:hypothetical protein